MRIYIFILLNLFSFFSLANNNKEMAIKNASLRNKTSGVYSKPPINSTKALISLNFQEIKVRAALNILAKFAGINILISDKVTGSLSINLKDIPWDDALDIILTTQSLGRQIIGGVMLIAPAEEILEREKKQFNALAERKNMAPVHSDFIQVKYAKATDIAVLLKDKKMTLLSTQGKILVDARTNQILVQDTKAHLKKIKFLINQVDTPVKQVLIEARIVNVTKDFVRELGLNFQVAKPSLPENAEERTKLTSTTLSSVTKSLANLNFDLVTTPLASSPASLGLALAKLADGILLDLELSALESEGRGEIISSPRLITTNQKKAVIESGEEIPYQESTSSGATSVVFKKAVLSLKVTPQITPEAKILLELDINQDLPSVKIFNGVPSILTKEIRTNVLVNNGQTIVLGGIYKQDKYKTVNRVPFLGELPVFGSLFKKKTSTIKNEELLIFITPRIMSNNLSSVGNDAPKKVLASLVNSNQYIEPKIDKVINQ